MRPDIIKSADDIFEFNCTQYQIFNYFFPFGEDVEILSPKELRERFIKTYDNALKKYTT